MACPTKDSAAWREQRFYNFLQYYDLHKYYRRLTGMGVTRISHLKVVDDETLEQIGMSRPERNRLRKKLEENFSTSGKLKVTKRSILLRMESKASGHGGCATHFLSQSMPYLIFYHFLELPVPLS